MASTEQIQTTVNFVSTHVDLMPIANVGGFTNEPALSIAKDTLQELLASPYDWKFNNATMPLLFTANLRQDYQFAGASAFVIGIGGASIDLTSNNAITESSFTVTVNTLQPHGFSVGQTVFMNGNQDARYNSVFTQTQQASGWSGGWAITATPTATQFQFVHALSGLPVSGAPGILNCSWLTEATCVDSADTSPTPQVWEITAVKSLKPSSQQGRPVKVSLVADGSVTGILTLRLTFIPQGSIYAITIGYQLRAPVLTSLANTWAPFPDEFGFIYRQGFLARCYRYLNSAKTDTEMAKSEAMIQKALARDDVEDSDQFVSPQNSIMGSWYPWP